MSDPGRAPRARNFDLPKLPRIQFRDAANNESLVINDFILLDEQQQPPPPPQQNVYLPLINK